LLLPTPETKKFGKTDDYPLLSQNILFPSHVFKTWEPNSPLPSIFCLLKQKLSQTLVSPCPLCPLWLVFSSLCVSPNSKLLYSNRTDNPASSVKKRRVG
jgi:hypothetical protein